VYKLTAIPGRKKLQKALLEKKKQEKKTNEALAI
jgi:hypothetical protein